VNALGAEKVHAAVFDIRDADAREAALQALPADFSEIDLLVNNAGLALGTGPAQTSDLMQWQNMIDTNVSALVGMTHWLLPKLIERKGMIVNIASAAATYPYPAGNVYGATKAFVVQFSLNLRSDLHGTGVRVSSIEPGFAETEFLVVRNGGDTAAAKQFYDGANPITAEDIARTVAWIAGQPSHLNINRFEIMPVSQSLAGFQIARQG
jgi:serine 3-dehydrogenase